MPAIAILGTKGGVSKSTLSMGLSIWISKLKPEKWSLLIDGDMHVRSVELKMCRVHDATLKDVLNHDKDWESAVYSCELEDEEGEPIHENLAILPAGGRFLPPMHENPVKHLEMTKNLFGNMMTGLREKFEYIIIDTPASIGFEHFTLTASSDAVIYVCEPNEDSIKSSETTSKELENLLGVKTLGVVLSRVSDEVNIEKWVEKAERIGPVLGTVPEDPKVGEAFRNNLPVVSAFPESPASLAIKEIAQKILDEKVERVDVEEKIERGLKKVTDKMD